MAQSNKRRRKGNGSLYTTVVVAIMLLAGITGVSVFFKVSDIIVVGNSAYSAKEIIDASGIELDSSIFFLRESASVVRIKDALAYIDDVRIVPTLPGTVTIEVTESYPIAYIEDEGSKWVIDNNARILEKLSANASTNAIPVYGVTPIMPAVGETLSLGDSGSVQLMYLKQVLSGMFTAGIYEDVQWLDMTSISAVKFGYMNKYTVNIGKGENVAYKLLLLEGSIASHADDDYKATIDISSDDQAHYIREK